MIREAELKYCNIYSVEQQFTMFMTKRVKIHPD